MPTVTEKQRVRDKIFNDVYPFTSDTIQCYAYPCEIDWEYENPVITISLTTDKMTKTDHDYLITESKPIDEYIPYMFDFREPLDETKYKNIKLGQRYDVTININPNAKGVVLFQVADKDEWKNADIIFN